MEDSTKKKLREDDDWDKAFLKKISNTIPQSVTYPEEDDDFVSTLLGIVKESPPEADPT